MAPLAPSSKSSRIIVRARQTIDATTAGGAVRVRETITPVGAAEFRAVWEADDAASRRTGHAGKEGEVSDAPAPLAFAQIVFPVTRRTRGRR